MSKLLYLSLSTIFFVLVNACTVSLINIGIDYSKIKSFSIEQFEVQAANAPPSSGQLFSEQLKNKVLNNTRLNYQNQKGDIQFKGRIVSYQIKSIAPNANQTVALQRLSIGVSVDYLNKQDDSDKGRWNQTFSRFADFGADQDITSVEEQLIQDIYDQILQDVFNKAFSGW